MLNCLYISKIFTTCVRYTHSQILLAYLDMRQHDPKICDIDCAYRLSKNPQYALSEDSILQIIKWAKRRV